MTRLTALFISIYGATSQPLSIGPGGIRTPDQAIMSRLVTDSGPERNQRSYNEIRELLRSGGDGGAAECAARNAIFEWLLQCPAPLSPEERTRVLRMILDTPMPEGGV